MFRIPHFTYAGNWRRLLLALGAMLLMVTPSPADQAEEGYRLPPEELVEIIDTPMTPWVLPGPDSRTFLMLDWNTLSTLQEMSEPELRLAGRRIRPATNAPSRLRPFTKMAILKLGDDKPRAVAGLPDEARLINVRWSPDGRHVSFTRLGSSGVELWVLDVDKETARALTGPVVSLTHGESPKWIDNQTILTTLVPDQRGAEPRKSAVPKSPVIQQNLGKSAPARTYQDLLENRHDEELFEHHFTTQLAKVGLDGKVEKLGDPAIFAEFDPSPDGRFVLVEILHRPFSYLVQANRFPKRTEIWNAAGEQQRLIYDRPVQESIPIAFGSVAVGPRNVEWRADAPATLVWAEAQDDGDAGKEAELRDRLFLLPAPFDGEARPLMDLAMRSGGVTWGDGELAMVAEFWWKTRQLRVWKVAPDDPEMAPVKLSERSFEDRYSDPGQPVMHRNSFGREVIRRSKDGKALFMIGNGASPEGNRPFLDRYELASGETQRLFHSEAPYFEEPMELLDDEAKLILTKRESVEQVPNYYLRDLATGDLQQVTRFPHPTPQLKGMSKELIKYQRDDGVQLTATLYLPPGHESSKGPLPTVMWAYPREFKSAAAAGQVDDSPYRFDRVGWWSSLLWLTQGYAVLDDPKMPIVGEEDEEPNDTFRLQLVANAKAAVDEMVRRGVSKPGHIAIGGHSYGAFMTANLLAHSDLFAAGIARSGAYNRTLTPFGFQSEERSLWEAPEIYFNMSPFMHAEKVNEPILLIHGAADNNPGTFPMQSERYFNALKGHGATARLVMLPLESHGYQARESILHVLWETYQWLETYISLEPEPEAVHVEQETGR